VTDTDDQPATVPELAVITCPAVGVPEIVTPSIVHDVEQLIVVNFAVDGDVTPIGHGISHVQPSRNEASRFGTCVVEETVNGGVPVVAVNVPPAAEKPPEKFGIPEKIGEPEKVPLIEPPPPSAFGPFDVSPTLKSGATLNVTAALKVFVPVHTLLELNSERFEDVILSIDQSRVPPEVVSTNLYALEDRKINARPKAFSTTGFAFGIVPNASEYVTSGVVVPAW
jgi:hypothetical protein